MAIESLPTRRPRGASSRGLLQWLIVLYVEEENMNNTTDGKHCFFLPLQCKFIRSM
jgi:hypothetical protein